jgi:hypothetical protein
MYGRHSILASVAVAALSCAAVVNADCDPTSLNTTSFNYVNDIANQTVYEMAVKFNRGVCDIGRANLSSLMPFPSSILAHPLTLP